MKNINLEQFSSEKEYYEYLKNVCLNIKMNKNIGYENKYKSIEFTLHNFKNNKKVLFNENEVKLNNNKFKVNL